MFKFGFDIEDEDDEIVIPGVTGAAEPGPSVAPEERAPAQPCHVISLNDLIATLPSDISYSPLPHPLSGAPLLRRDLYDARFQLAQGTDAGDVPAYIDAETDLIPGTYEGGLKSWEGGVDLVEVVARACGEGERGGEGVAEGGGEEARVAAWVRGARVLEIGCGTGLPSAYLLRALLSSPRTGTDARTVLHLQDYNLPVLSLVTLPNLVLAALPSLPLSAQAAAEAAPEDPADAPGEDGLDDIDEGDEDAEGEDEDEQVDNEQVDAVSLDERRPFDPSRAGTLDLTPALLDAFTHLLDERGIELRFTYGDWGGMAESLAQEAAYDLVLTAETIYAEDSVGALIDVLRAAGRTDARKDAAHPEPEAALEESLDGLSLGADWAEGPLTTTGPVVLVAAKVLYFGVGGGLESFVAHVRALGGHSTRVRDWVRGVGRAVVRVVW